MLDVSPEEFDGLVADALDLIPPRLATLIDNCVVLVQEEPPDGSDEVLGLYEGVPLTERDSWYVGALPDRITLFRRPILRSCRTRAEVVREVRITVVHEIAHHFGIDDERLEELGWG